MFGYVRPLKGELKVSEYERFRAVYCGLCHMLSRRYGFGARFLLSYDLAFYAAVADGLDGSAAPEFRRCAASPFRKKCILCKGSGMELAADLTVLLGYKKLDDEVHDSGFFRGLGSRFLRLLLTPYYRKARRYRPELSEKVDEALAALGKLESERCDSIDYPADAFARILSAAGEELEGERTARMFYHVGRWIYIVDACDDLEEDIAARRYNPVAERFGLTGPPDVETKAHLEGTLGFSLDAAWEAARELKLGREAALVENTLRLGLYAVMEEVLAGRWKAKKSKRTL